jgi:hypothetical protein
VSIDVQQDRIAMAGSFVLAAAAAVRPRCRSGPVPPATSSWPPGWRISTGRLRTWTHQATIVFRRARPPMTARIGKSTWPPPSCWAESGKPDRRTRRNSAGWVRRERVHPQIACRAASCHGSREPPGRFLVTTASCSDRLVVTVSWAQVESCRLPGWAMRVQFWRTSLVLPP